MSNFAKRKLREIRHQPETPGPRAVDTGHAARPVPATDAGPIASSAELPESIQRGLESPSMGLQAHTRRFLESRLGHDFSKVRIHHDARANRSAASLNARAYTLGVDVVFGPGEFAPSTRRGVTLLAHELAHVAQNRGRAFEPGKPLRTLSRREAAETEASNLEASFFDPGRTSISRAFPDNGQAWLGRKTKDQEPPQPPPLSTGIRKGAQLGAGRISFYPRSISKTRQGAAPAEVGLRDVAGRLNVIIGAGITIQSLAEYLLPLWNDAQPSRPDPNLGESAVPSTPVTAYQLARALVEYNSGALQNMKQWSAGFRFALPIIIDEKTEEGIVNSNYVVDLVSGFEDTKIGWLTQPAGAQETQNESQVKDAVRNFLAEKTDPTARGYGLASRALTNAEKEQRFILECLDQMSETDRLNAAIWFMELVGAKVDVLSSQRAGVAILDGVRAIFAKASASNDPKRQEDIARATKLLQHGRAVEIALAKRDWPTILPRVVRGQKQHIQKVPGKLELSIPEVPVRELSETEKGIVQQIRDARAALPPPSDKLTVRPWKTDPQAGYFYAGSNVAAGKSAAQGDQRRQEVLSAINEEIGREGRISAVNTYDDAVVTLASGFTRAKLADLMQNFFKRDPAAQDKFLDLGITWEKGIALVVNTGSDNTKAGGVEEKDDALHLIQLDPRILTFFVSLAEDPEHGPQLGAAQAKVLGAGPAMVPQSVIDTWTDTMAIRLVAHAIQFRSAKSWSDYEGTNGDVKQIVRILMSVTGKVDAARGNATFVDTTQAGVIFSFAGGKAKEAFTSPAGPLPADLAKGSYGGHIFVDDGGGSFLHLAP